MAPWTIHTLGWRNQNPNGNWFTAWFVTSNTYIYIYTYIHIYIYIYICIFYKCPGFWLTRPDFADITLLDLCIGSPIFHGVQLLCIFSGFLEIFVAFWSLLILILSKTCCYSATIIVFFSPSPLLNSFKKKIVEVVHQPFPASGHVEKPAGCVSCDVRSRGITSVHVEVLEAKGGTPPYWTLSILGVAILSLKMHRTSQNYMKNKPYYT